MCWSWLELELIALWDLELGVDSLEMSWTVMNKQKCDQKQQGGRYASRWPLHPLSQPTKRIPAAPPGPFGRTGSPPCKCPSAPQWRLDPCEHFLHRWFLREGNRELGFISGTCLHNWFPKARSSSLPRVHSLIQAYSGIPCREYCLSVNWNWSNAYLGKRQKVIVMVSSWSLIWYLMNVWLTITVQRSNSATGWQ